MARTALAAVVVAFVFVSCTSGEPTPTTADESTGTTGDGSAPAAEEPTTTLDVSTTEPGQSQAPGRLVLLDGSGDVVVVNPDGSNRRDITDDAGEAAAYTQPIWSPDASTIAWGQVTETGFAVGIHEPGSGETTTVATPNLPFYMYWSPDGQNLGVLHNGTTGVQFRMINVASGTSVDLDEDAPFYFSWSPESDRVVTHAGGQRVETIRPDGERVTLEPTGATYLAPQWTDAGVFHVVDERLVLEDRDGEREPIATVSGPTTFVANARGTKVALQTTGEDPATSVSTEDFPAVVADAVVVIDVATRGVDVASSEPAIGFFWDAAGVRLLMLVVVGNEVVPQVWSDDVAVEEFTGYLPPGTMLQDTFPFFPQYAQSVSFWAPDSSAFAFAGDIGGERGIWVQELDQESPRFLTEGIWVAWSS